MRLVFLGPPGAGKGTQSELLKRRLGVPQLSTGDMLRGAVRAASPVGLKAKAIMDAGQLVSDDVVIGIVAERIEEADAGQGFILDGFPRTVAQAEALEELLAERALRLDGVLELEVNEAALVSRIEKRVEETRAAGGVVRADDQPETLKARLDAYKVQTSPVSTYYDQRGLLYRVNGMLPIDTVTGSIEEQLAAMRAVHQQELR